MNNVHQITIHAYGANLTGYLGYRCEGWVPRFDIPGASDRGYKASESAYLLEQYFGITYAQAWQLVCLVGNALTELEHDDPQTKNAEREHYAALQARAADRAAAAGDTEAQS